MIMKNKPVDFPSWVKLLRQWQPAAAPRPQGEIYRWPVYAETARFKKLAGYLELVLLEEGAQEAFPEPAPLPETILITLKNLFRKNSRLAEDRLLAGLRPAAAELAWTPEKLARELVVRGYLGRWVRLRPDEKSIAAVLYGPLERLAAALSSDQEQFLSENWQWTQALSNKIAALEDQSAPLQEKPELAALFPAVRQILYFLGEKIEQVTQVLNTCRRAGEPERPAPEKLALHPLFPWTFHPWGTKGKFHLGVEFLAALVDCLLRSPGGFEWKELGGGFTPGIGSSKRFDSAREDLLELAEAVAGIPVERLGLTSTGSLYSLYLLGRLKVFYRGVPPQEFNSTINALTNVQVQRLTGLEVPAGRVVLTENRALLLKMEAAEWQNTAPETLVLGLDGRLRLAHGRFLKLLAESCPKTPWFAWVDTDEAGLAIARQVAHINPGCRFILPPLGPELKTPQELAGWLEELAKNPSLRNREQEENLGYPEMWNELFKCQKDTGETQGLKTSWYLSRVTS